MQSLTEEQRAYVEDMGSFVERNGSQRTVGRVMAALLISDQPMTQEDLMQLLGLSRTSASVALKYLERMGLLQMICVSGQRKRIYRTRLDIVEWSASTTYRQLQEKLRLCRAAEQVAEPQSREMLHSMRDLITFLSERLIAAYSEWLATRSPTQAAGTEPARRSAAMPAIFPPPYS